MQSADLWSFTTIALDFVCQNCKPWSRVWNNITLYTVSWLCFQKETIMYFLGTVRTQPGTSSSQLSPKRLSGVKKIICLPPFFSPPPGMWPLSNIYISCHENTLCGTRTPSSCKEFWRDPSVPVRSYFYQCVLESHGHRSHNLWIVAVLFEPRLVASFVKCLTPISCVQCLSHFAIEFFK